MGERARILSLFHFSNLNGMILNHRRLLRHHLVLDHVLPVYQHLQGALHVVTLAVNVKVVCRLTHGTELEVAALQGRGLPLWAHELRGQGLEVAQLVSDMLALVFGVQVVLLQVVLRLRFAYYLVQSIVVFVDLHCLLHSVFVHCLFHSVLNVQGLACLVRDRFTAHRILDARDVYVFSSENFVQLPGDNKILAIKLLLVKLTIEPMNVFFVVI